MYRVWVNGSDATGAADSQFFVFAIDTTAPSISAASPAPGGLYATGTQLNFTITDEHLSTNATWDAGFGQVPFPSPWNVSTVGWADGWWNVTVHAWDTAGNGASGTFNYALDGNAPTIALNSPSNNSVIASGTTIDLSIADAFFNNTSWSTGGPWTGFTSPFDVSTTGWGDGLTTLVVAAFDQLGRQTVRSYVFTLDSTAPSITLNTPSNGSIIQAGTSLDFSVGDANFQNSSWSNGGPWFSFNSPFDINTGGWADGAVTVTVRAFDQAGNSRTSTFDFSVDTTAPSITLGSPVNNSLIAAGSTIDFAISDAHTFSASWNNGNGSTPFSSPFDVVTTGWADGVVTVVVTATDSAGNGRTASFSFDVDGTLPAITLNTPANNSYVSAGRSLDLSVAEAHPGTVTWNNGSGAVGLSSPYDVPTTGWADGSVNVTVVATDAVGNARTVVFHFTMDSTLPAVALLAPANNPVSPSGTLIDLAVTDTNLNTVTWNNGSGNLTLGSPFDINTTGWLDGIFAVTVTATDLAGNVRVFVVGITLDNIAPSIGLNQPTNSSTFGAGTLIDLSITDLHSLSATWDNGSGTNNLSAPFDIDTTGWTDGAYTVAIVATDVAGNSATASFDFTIDNAFPAVILNTPSNNSVIPSGTVLDFDVVDADLNTVTYDTGSGSLNFSAPYDLDTTGFSEGPLNVTVRADDNSSHIVIVVFRFTIDDTDPLLSLTGPANNSVLSAGSTIDLSVTEVNLDYAAYDNGNGTQLLPAPFDIDTSGWSDGGVDVSVTVYDLAGHSAAATFHFTMDSTAPAISMGSPSNNSVLSPGATLDFSITDVHSFNATWGNGSGPFSFSSPFDVATSGWADGAVTVTVSATDIAGNLRVASFAFTIDSVAPSIALTAPSNASVIPAGTTLDFALSDVHTFNATWSNGSGGPFALA
ncbi:MAG TPA: Ig-like domain-containing protein, partial [Candidatus Thermoplasmatota archaeon]|nr:Ig-like domain-containing protein [Candidatus Thermoplasmatota archaeon]